MAAQPTPWISVEDYLQAERAATFRSEYCNGEVFAMAGGAPTHSFLIANFAAAFWTALRNTGCHVSVTELRLQVTPAGLYTYPDLMVICGEPALADGHNDMITNPTLIVEVLSPSTEAYDRGAKFEQYQLLPSLQHYILASQHKPRLEAYSRQPDQTWTYKTAQGPAATLDLPALKCQVRLDDLYADVPGISLN